MKIYLAKSNRCNPEDYMKIRSFLKSRKVEIEEYIGGDYDAKATRKLRECDMLIVLPESTKMPITLGKGIFLQICSFLEITAFATTSIRGATNNKPAYIITNVGSLSVLKIDHKRMKISKPDDYVNFAKYDDDNQSPTYRLELLLNGIDFWSKPKTQEKEKYNYDFIL